jgi:hypothetical protein
LKIFSSKRSTLSFDSHSPDQEVWQMSLFHIRVGKTKKPPPLS